MSDPTTFQGRYFEDFSVGDRFRHPMGRTVLEADNVWFTLLTQNAARIHVDHEFAAQTSFGKPLVNSTFTLALVTGQSVLDVSFNVMANLGWDDVRLPHPVFVGDTLYSASTVLALRDSASHPEAGLVTVATTGRNQRDETVVSFTRALLVYRHGHGPRPFPLPTSGDRT